MNIIRAPYSKLTIHEPLLVCIMEKFIFWKFRVDLKENIKVQTNSFYFLEFFLCRNDVFLFSILYEKYYYLSDFLCKNYCSTNCCLSLSSSSRSLCTFKLFVSYAKEFYNRIVQRGNMKVVFPERD